MTWEHIWTGVSCFAIGFAPFLIQYIQSRHSRGREVRADTIEEWRKLYVDTRSDLARERTERRAAEEACEERVGAWERRLEEEMRRRRRMERAMIRHGIDPDGVDGDAGGDLNGGDEHTSGGEMTEGEQE